MKKSLSKEAKIYFVIVSCLVVLGFIVYNSLREDMLDRQKECLEAIQIDNDSDLFQYAMNTDIGNAYVYGILKADNPVSYDGVDGEYLYIRREEEHYEKHTKKVGKRTEVYYSWDYWSAEDKHTDTITFCGVQFPYSQLDRPTADFICIDKFALDKRYVYYAVPKKITGTVYNYLSDGKLLEKISIRENTNIEQARELDTSDYHWVVVFCLGWILVLCFAVGVTHLILYIREG